MTSSNTFSSTFSSPWFPAPDLHPVVFESKKMFFGLFGGGKLVWNVVKSGYLRVHNTRRLTAPVQQTHPRCVHRGVLLARKHPLKVAQTPPEDGAHAPIAKLLSRQRLVRALVIGPRGYFISSFACHRATAHLSHLHIVGRFECTHQKFSHTTVCCTVSCFNCEAKLKIAPPTLVTANQICDEHFTSTVCFIDDGVMLHVLYIYEMNIYSRIIPREASFGNGKIRAKQVFAL